MPRTSLTKSFDNSRFRGRNPVAEKYDRLFRDVFEGDILPRSKASESFAKKDAPLYIDVRKVTNGKPVEERLQEQFWDAERKRLVFLEGPVGCGKSTVIAYYLRCLCPLERPQEFQKKLIISVDLARTQDAGRFDEKLFKAAKEAIIRQCTNSIETENGCEMFAEKFGFTAADEMSFRLARVKDISPNIDNKDWVNLALTYLARRAKVDEERAKIRWMVVCLDNLDQSKPEVQKHALDLIKEWLHDEKDTIEIYRVFVPVWPDTLDRMLRSLGSYPVEWEPLSVEPLDYDIVLTSRMNEIEKGIQAAVDSDPDAEPLDLEFLRDWIKWALPKFASLVQNLAGGSTRRFLEFWRSTISSSNLYNVYCKRAKTPGMTQALPNYYMLDGLMTGEYRTHASESPVSNLFTLTGTKDGPEDLLLGPLLLHGIRGGVRSREGARERFERLGFRDVGIENALNGLEDAGVFYLVGGRRDEIKVIDEVLQGHIDLLSERAYLDNIAMTTPVNLEQMEVMERRTGNAQDYFFPRTWNALTFLGQILADEDSFWKPGNSYFEPQTAAKEAATLKLPSIFRLCATAYLVNLKRLRQSRMLDHDRVSEWNELLNHPILKVASEWPTTLSEIITQRPKPDVVVALRVGRRSKITEVSGS